MHEVPPTLGFLAAVLVVAHLAGVYGVFTWLGAKLAAACHGRPRRLLVLTFAAAAGTTAVLSLDATVVLLTPVVHATARRLKLTPRPHVFACAHLANSASTLLPVSNLTNLLAFSASGLTFGAFTKLMALPWLVTIALELGVFVRFFAEDLEGHGEEEADVEPAPVFALVVVALTLAGFGVAPLLRLAPAWVAAAAAVVLAAPALARRLVRVRDLVLAANPVLCLAVFVLAWLVELVPPNLLGAMLPEGTGLAELLLTAVIAAVLANVVNNLPATLLLLAALGPHPAAGLVLAVLLGVNLGPNATYHGSLATLLWRRTLPTRPSARDFFRLGMLTTPLTLGAATAALWLSL
ncbi:arsenic transporter [Amycolatopsis sp. K13G38]|uniref:Arsenic transporter n=1 Tax=Amycolatopsis acididurans TaxID=2724524 RepID=A0ABX1JCH5_9PSEU|nr:SLC13 family permease [Amycolatopsis acididurans]NKQ57368.1 arsenic transporter [Amycolatopsis acididurans]